MRFGSRSFDQALVVLLSVILLGGGPALADPPTASPDKPVRPRIGLALSGGGARGAAHVGVLKVLEELRVPVDVIAGASMGSIVGGLYATGMSPQEMEDALAAMDWDGLFEDDVPRSEQPFRRKLDQAQYLSRLVIGIEKGKPSLPSGLVQGQKLNFVLRKLTLPAATTTDFDKLNVPYRATATDASSGTGVVLKGGNIADAIRASMAFPGLFAPVEIDGRLLIDGGVAENFPVQTARDAGAEVLIAVNIGTPLAGKEKLTTLLSIVNQVTNVATARNVQHSKDILKPSDIFFEPDLTGISFIDFAKVREAVAAGEKAARKVADRLATLSISEEEYRAWKERQRRKPAPPREISSIEIVNTSPLSNDFLMKQVRSRPGPLDLDVLEKDLARIHALGQFDLVDFKIDPQDGKNVLRIIATVRSWGLTSARFGLDLSTDFKGDSGFVVAASLLRTSVNRLGAEWKIQGGVGEVETVVGEFYQPLSAGGPFFFAPRVAWRSERLQIPQPGYLVDYSREDVFGQLDAGITDGKYGELRVGIRRGYLWANPKTEGAELPEVRADRGAVSATLTIDSRDNVPFPRSGLLIRGDLSWETPDLGAETSYRRAYGLGMGAFTFGKNTIQLVASGGGPAGTDAPYYSYFNLGGFRRLSGYKPNELWGPYMAFGSLSFLREIGRLPSVLGGGVYLGGSLEAGNTWTQGADVSLSALRFAGSLYLAGETPLGPIYLAVGYAEKGRTSLYLVLGYPF